MPIILVRIDDRLVHGQIVQGWLKSIDVNTIVVASDSVAADGMQQVLMSMAVPSGIELEVKTVKDAAEAMVGGKYDKAKVMVLAASPKDVLYMIENGAEIKTVNVGGMHFVHGKKQVLCNLSVDDCDVKNLYAIYEKGIEIEGRVLPADERTNIIPLIEKEYKNIRKVNGQS